MTGKTYGVRVEGTNDIYVSPAVFELLKSDREKIMEVLKYRNVKKWASARRGRKQWEG